MSDALTPEKRSWNMSRIRSKDTKPEIIVRQILHSMGYRFRLHSPNFPGHPDIILPKYKAIIFVHGCFWHRHEGCKYAYNPKSKVEFWQNKFKNNTIRDEIVKAELSKLGWKQLTIWECETKNKLHIQNILKGFLYDRNKCCNKRNIT